MLSTTVSTTLISSEVPSGTYQERLPRDPDRSPGRRPKGRRPPTARTTPQMAISRPMIRSTLPRSGPPKPIIVTSLPRRPARLRRSHVGRSRRCGWPRPPPARYRGPARQRTPRRTRECGGAAWRREYRLPGRVPSSDATGSSHHRHRLLRCRLRGSVLDRPVRHTWPAVTLHAPPGAACTRSGGPPSRAAGEQPPARAVSRAAWLGLVPAVVALVLLRLPSLVEPSWYPDEGTYADIGRAIAHGAVLYRDVWDNKPPAMYWLTTALTLRGVSVPVLRAVLAALVAVGTLAVFILGRRLGGGRVAVMASLTYALLASLPNFDGDLLNAEVVGAVLVLLAMTLMLRETARRPQGAVLA